MKIKLSTLKSIIREEIQRNLRTFDPRKFINEVYDECPCGMDRSMCDYHKPEVVQPSNGSGTFSPGQRVRIKKVDMYGFTGRDDHPQKSDIGRTGKVTGIAQDSRDLDIGLEDDEHYIVYDVTMDEDDHLELMDFELEAI